MIGEAVGGREMAGVHVGLDGVCKVTCDGILGTFGGAGWGGGREGMLFTLFRVGLGWSRSSFDTPVSFTMTPDGMHGTRGGFTVGLASEVVLGRGRFSLMVEGSILTGLTGEGRGCLSWALEHLNYVFRNWSIRKVCEGNPNQSYLPLLQR